MTAQMPLVTFGPGQIAAVGTVAGQGRAKWRSSSAPGFVPATESAPEAALEEAGDAQCLSSWELSLQTEIR